VFHGKFPFIEGGGHGPAIGSVWQKMTGTNFILSQIEKFSRVQSRVFSSFLKFFAPGKSRRKCVFRAFEKIFFLTECGFPI